MTHNITINTDGDETIVTAWAEIPIEVGTEIRQLWQFTVQMDFTELEARIALALKP